MSSGARQPDDLAILGPELPQGLDGARVLDVTLAPDALSQALTERGAGEVVTFDPATEQREGFDLIVCRGLLQAGPHPMNLLSRIWHLADEGALLLLSSGVLTDPERSRFAQFVLPSHPEDAPQWLPGRLALRWSVEVSGFTVERWLGPGPEADEGPEALAFLRATRTDRTPALDLATPSPGQ
jgi:hypothetical protein